jgi:hypothetical protein
MVKLSDSYEGPAFKSTHALTETRRLMDRERRIRLQCSRCSGSSCSSAAADKQFQYQRSSPGHIHLSRPFRDVSQEGGWAVSRCNCHDAEQETCC